MKKLLVLIALLVAALALSVPMAIQAQMKYKEAPMLTPLVRQGKLPPVEQRLPEKPLVWNLPDVMEQEDGIGKYGGTLRTAHQFEPVAIATIGLVRVAANRKDYYPDIAESWEWGPNWKSITFKLRKGMRWSDGHPFTADDIAFWYNEIIRSKYIKSPMPAPGMNSITDKIVKVDDYTLRFEFANPNPQFFDKGRGFAGGEVSSLYHTAAHYMKQFHPDYNPKAGVSAEQQFKDLQDMLAFPRYLEDPNRPVLWAWKVAEYKMGQFLRMERNPYFWVVDREGNQLPYIDYVECAMLQDKDTEVIKLKILSGEIDWERRRGLIIDLPLYRENESKAGIDVVLTIKPEGSQQGIKFNPGHPDPDVRAVIDNADFRRALSIAIDRRVIQETGYLGLGKVGHGFSPPGVYNPEIDGAWAQHDPDRASKMLDSIGLNKRDSEGYRLLPNGKKFTFTLLFMPGWHAGHNETAEVATEGWRKVGIRAIAKPVDSRLLNATLWDSRQYEAWIDPWVGGLESQNLAYGTGLIRWANLQKQWWNNRNLPADKRPGIEPKGSLVKLLELEDTALSTSDPNEMQRAIDEHRRVMADQMWVIGIVQDLPHLLIVKKNLRNVWGRKKPIILGAGDEDYWPRSWYFDR